jgi:hypothetical protein
MRRRAPVALGLLALAALAAAAVAVVLMTLALRDDTSARPPIEAPSEIDVRATVAPRPVLFGDAVRASVDVVLDTDKIDPESVRVAAVFFPWEVVGRPDRRVVSTGDQAHVRTTFVLRCLTGACVPSGPFAL